MVWALETATNTGTAPPTRPHFLLLFKPFYQHFNCLSPQAALFNPPHYAFIPAPRDGHTMTQTHSTALTLSEAPLQSLFQSWEERKLTFQKVCRGRVGDIVCIIHGHMWTHSHPHVCRGQTGCPVSSSAAFHLWAWDSLPPKEKLIILAGLAGQKDFRIYMSTPLTSILGLQKHLAIPGYLQRCWLFKLRSSC